MRKLGFLTIFFCLLVSQGTKLQTQSLKNKAIMQAREMGDTLITRFNNKIYYTVKLSTGWDVKNGTIAFHPFSIYDTSGDMMLQYVTDKTELLKRLHKGDTIQNYFLVDMKISFTDFADIQVSPAVVVKPLVFKSEKKTNHKDIKLKPKTPAPQIVKQTHSASRHKKIDSMPCSKPVIFNNCVFGGIVADTGSDIYQDDASKKKMLEFKEDVEMINCTFTGGIEIADCIFKKEFVLSGQLLSQSTSLIDNCQFEGVCYVYSCPELGNWQSSFTFNECKFNEPFIFTTTNSDRAHFSIERSKINSVLSFGRSVPDYIFKKFRLTYAGLDYFYRLNDYVDWYSEFLANKFNQEYEMDDDTIEDFVHNDRVLYNTTIYDTKIKCLDIANTNFHDCSFEDVSIEKCVDVTNGNFTYSPDFKGKQALEDFAFPGNDGVIYAGLKTFSPEAFKLGNYIERINIHPLVHNYFDTAEDFTEENTNFYDLIKDYAEKKFSNNDIVTSVKARYEHEKAFWERQYHAAHMKAGNGVGDKVSSFFSWVMGEFLEATVSTGYKGETKFISWVLILIIFFSFIYYLRHRLSVIDYLNSMYNKDAAALKDYDTLKVFKLSTVFRDYFRCLWFSCLVFVDPRLPITFFNLRVGLFGLVLAEWLCGLTAITLFLVFLASNYPFIHSLIGI